MRFFTDKTLWCLLYAITLTEPCIATCSGPQGSTRVPCGESVVSSGVGEGNGGSVVDGLAIQAKIKGGHMAQSGRFPYMVSLRDDIGNHSCGASLIAAKWALTAAHCVHPESRDTLGLNSIAVIGSVQRDAGANDEGIEMIRVVRTYIHEEFQPRNLYTGFDIALLELEEPSKYTPIGLPDPKADFTAGKSLLALGWGEVAQRESSYVLRHARLAFVPWGTCVKEWEGLPQSLICAWNPGADACQGDSGGPLIIPYAPKQNINAGHAKFDTLVGITSFGDTVDCGASTLPGVYTKVATFVPWIEAIMNTGCDASTQVIQEVKKSPTKQVSNPDLGFEVNEAKSFTRPPEDATVQELSEAMLDAAVEGDALEVQVLVRAGADVNFRRRDHWTALLIAAHEGHEDIVKVLIDSGANMEARTKEGWTPLIRASYDGHSRIVKILAGAGADVNARTYEGNTALIHAAFRGHLGDVEVLIESGAGTKIKNKDGSTAKNVICGDPAAECSITLKRNIEKALTRKG